MQTLAENILSQMPWTPTQQQSEAVDVFCRFMADRGRCAMILRGSAGTGKTSVARAIVAAMVAWRQKVVLMAPTGRAAKVLAMGMEEIRDIRGKALTAHTIHRRIYRQQRLSADGGVFSLNDNLHTDTLFLVDEASMIGDASTTGQFGSGSLLDDLIRYVYGGRNCRLLLIGDTAQLPPVGMEEAPALATMVIEGYGLPVYDYDMTEVLRQASESGILVNATMVRKMITHDEMTQLPMLRFRGFPDIHVVPGGELIETLASSYVNAGYDETIVITRSNKRANIYNQGIRFQVLGREEELSGGDRLMVVKNHYLDQQQSSSGSSQNSVSPDNSETPAERTLSFIANGDRAVVERVTNVREFYGFRFADVWLSMPDYEGVELFMTVILDTLHSEAPALTQQQQEQLYEQVIADYDDIPSIVERRKKVRDDAYFNALQVKYAYAVTCHKAQGGQWSHVFVDQGYMTDDMLTPSYIHWLYTAFTRATDHLFLVNWPKNQMLDSPE